MRALPGLALIGGGVGIGGAIDVGASQPLPLESPMPAQLNQNGMASASELLAKLFRGHANRTAHDQTNGLDAYSEKYEKVWHALFKYSLILKNPTDIWIHREISSKLFLNVLLLF
jgi:hypothetical protein